MADNGPLLLRFHYDRRLILELLDAGAKVIAAREQGWRSFLPMGAGLVMGATMVALASALPILTGTEIDLLGVLAGFGMGAAMIALMQRLVQRGTVRVLAESATFREPVEMELRREGILMRSEIAETALRWTAIDDLIELREGLGLVIGQTVLPLPDAALPEGIDRTELCRLIVSWRKAASPADA